MVEKHKTLKSVSVNIVGKKFLEFALKKVKYGDEDRLMLSISKGNAMPQGLGEVRRHSKALSIPFEGDRMKRIHDALGQVIAFGDELEKGECIDTLEDTDI